MKRISIPNGTNSKHDHLWLYNTIIRTVRSSVSHVDYQVHSPLRLAILAASVSLAKRIIPAAFAVAMSARKT